MLLWKSFWIYWISSPAWGCLGGTRPEDFSHRTFPSPALSLFPGPTGVSCPHPIRHFPRFPQPRLIPSMPAFLAPCLKTLSYHLVSTVHVFFKGMPLTVPQSPLESGQRACRPQGCWKVGFSWLLRITTLSVWEAIASDLTSPSQSCFLLHR